jgi:ribosomal protein L24E
MSRSQQIMGEWQERGKASDYLNQRAVDCRFCGKSIPRRAWVAVQDGRESIFCDPECERLYREYWLPRYGAQKS